MYVHVHVHVHVLCNYVNANYRRLSTLYVACVETNVQTIYMYMYKCF